MVARLVTTCLPSPGPLRRLSAGSLATNLGNGAWFTTCAVYLTRDAGLAAAAVGAGMAVSSGLSMVVSTPLGRLADRLGPREVWIALLALQAVASASFLVVHGFVSFLLVACLADVGS